MLHMGFRSYLSSVIGGYEMLANFKEFDNSGAYYSRSALYCNAL